MTGGGGHVQGFGSKAVGRFNCYGFETPVTRDTSGGFLLKGSSKMMRNIICMVAVVLLTACVTTQQYAAAPSVSQMQGQCLAQFQTFLEQTTCIENYIAQYSHAQPNPFTQEYIAYMNSLSAKVKAGQVTENDARVQLTQRLNELRQKQNTEFAQQQAIANQRAAQTQQVLQQNKQPPLEVYEMKTLPTPTTTNCQAYGNQVNCTTY